MAYHKTLPSILFARGFPWETQIPHKPAQKVLTKKKHVSVTNLPATHTNSASEQALAVLTVSHSLTPCLPYVPSDCQHLCIADACSHVGSNAEKSCMPVHFTNPGEDSGKSDSPSARKIYQLKGQHIFFFATGCNHRQQHKQLQANLRQHLCISTCAKHSSLCSQWTHHRGYVT